jgi:hypothetical protein
VRKLILRNMQQGRKMLAEIIAIGQKRGEISPFLKKEKIALQVLQTCMGTVLVWSLHEEPSLSVWIEDSFQNFWRSIANSSRKQES